MQRRDFLKAIGAAGVAAAALAGLRDASARRSGPKVVVVGGGYGGATAAKYIRMWSNGTRRRDAGRADRRLRLLSRCRTWCWAAARQIADVTVSYDGLAQRMASRFVRDTATAVDADKRTVRSSRRGSDLPYDRLVLSPGVDFHVGQGAGLGQRRGASEGPARVEGGSADRGAAPAAGGDARRRRLRDLDSA